MKAFQVSHHLKINSNKRNIRLHVPITFISIFKVFFVNRKKKNRKYKETLIVTAYKL